MKSPLLVLAGCFSLGILLARERHWAILGPVFAIPVLLAVSAMCLLLGLVIHRQFLPAYDPGQSRSPEASQAAAVSGPAVELNNLQAEHARSVGTQITFWFTICEALALAGFAFAGAAAWRLFEIRFPPHDVSHLEALGIEPRDPVRITGRIVSVPQRIGSLLQFDLEAAAIAPGNAPQLDSHNLPAAPANRAPAVTGKVRVQLDTSRDFAALDKLHLEYGDRLQALVRLRRPRVYRNPGSFDFRDRLVSIEDIFWIGTITSPRLVENLAQPGTVPLSAYPDKARSYLLKTIDRIYPPWTLQGRYGAVLKAVLLGDRSAIDSDTVENFRKAGLFHLLVIAGLHVGLLAMLVEMLLRLVRLNETCRSVLLLLFLVGYAILVEQRAATLRATLMISTYLLARLLYRDSNALNSIGLAALVLLIHRPAWLLDSGFQLSFSAALLIVGLVVPVLDRTTEPYRRALREVHEVDVDAALEPRQAQFRIELRMLISALMKRSSLLKARAGLATAMVTAPVRAALWTANIFLFSALLQLGLLLPMAETFHRITFAGIGLNALAIPVMTVLLGMAAPTVLLAAIAPALAMWPAKLLAQVMKLLFFLTQLPHLPAWLSYRVPEPPVWVAWGFAGSAVAAAYTLGRRRGAFGICIACFTAFMLLLCFHPFAPRLPHDALELTALDCTAGDVFFLVLPDRSTMLVAAGTGRTSRFVENWSPFERHRWDPGEEIVSPYLWSRGLKRIEVLAVLGEWEGVGAVLQNFRVGEIWYFNKSQNQDFAGAAMLAEAQKRRVALRELGSGGPISRTGTSIQLLAEPGVESLIAGAESPGLRISDDEITVLIAHPSSGEHHKPDLLNGRRVKSASSEKTPAALRHLRARVASNLILSEAPVVVKGSRWECMIVPAGASATFLETIPARVFRTDVDGAISVEMKDGGLSAHCYARACGS